MQPGDRAGSSRILSILAVLFLGAYFFLFAGDGLHAYFTFDDGMNMVHLHRLWEVSWRTNVLEAAKVFTTAYRPLGALFYRPLYALFGFNPLPYRMVCYGLMIFNCVLAYRFARILGATPETAALSTLLVCYNASMIDLYYNSGTIYDLLCFPLYIGAVIVYARHRSKHGQLPLAVMLLVLLLFLAALDAKEMAVTLPAALLLYEICYRCRDFRSLRSWLRTGAFVVVMFAVAAAFLRVKVSEMSSNTFYHPHLSVSYVLSGIGHYVEELFYLQSESFGPGHVVTAAALLLGCAAILRSPIIAFGTLLFGGGLLPLSVIVHRTGYAAYVVYPGLTVALAAILTSARSALVRAGKRENLHRASMAALFLCVAVVSVKSFAHTRKILISNALWDEQRRIDFLSGLRQRVPEFPPNVRILVLDDPWTSDWGPMFLAELMYQDPSLWMDRVKNAVETGDRDSYDLLVTYEQPLQKTVTTRLLGVKKSWETHWAPLRKGEFAITAPKEDRAPREVSFSPGAAHGGSPVTVTIPGLSNVKIDVVYRLLSDGKWAAHTGQGWCTLDSGGTCAVSVPHGQQLAVDWVRVSRGRWILVSGRLALLD